MKAAKLKKNLSLNTAKSRVLNFAARIASGASGPSRLAQGCRGLGGGASLGSGPELGSADGGPALVCSSITTFDSSHAAISSSRSHHRRRRREAFHREVSGPSRRTCPCHARQR